MDEQIFYNAFFLYSATIFTRFILASSSPDNTSRYSSTRCPDGYLTRVIVDRQLVQYLLPINARTFIHHLYGAACECSYCEVAFLLSVRAPRARCFRCRVRRWSLSCARCRSYRTRDDALPVDVLLLDGEYLVTRISPSDANRLLDSLTAYTSSNPRQAELQTELLTLLAMAPLSPGVLRRHFERHLST